jgi:hypothetical protein
VYRRRNPTREPYDVVLPVCEGSKTEPNYFKEARLAYQLSSLNIQIRQPPCNDPLTIVNFAIEQLTRDLDYNRAYCVFDRDQHASFDQAIRRAEESEVGTARRLFVIPSVPCFEIWILLHYRYTAGAYTAAGGQTACERLIREVRRHLANYEKGRTGVFAELSGMLNQALANAARLEKHNADTASLNPATRMHHLICYLRGLRQR